MGETRGSRRTAAATCAAGLLLLAGCSGSDEPADPETESPTATPTTTSAAAYPSSAASASLTEPGTDLSYGQGASVAWQAKADAVGTIRVSVDSVERTTFKKSFKDWKTEGLETYTPYFVRAYVTNLGDTDLSSVAVPLYGESSADALIEPSSFPSVFKPCNPSSFPRGFTAGVATSVCLVYLVPDGGELAGVVFRPTEEFAPITWIGTARTIAAAPTS